MGTVVLEIWLALFTPEPDVASEDPVPNTIAAVVFVLPVTPENGDDVAAIVPEPLVLSADPVPTVIVAELFVPVVMVLKAAEPAVPPLVPQENA